MCGRYSLTTPPEAMRRLFGFDAVPNLPARYNIAPTQGAPIVRAGVAGGPRDFAMARWGLLPRFVKALSEGARMINARAETVATKPAFRAAFRQRRCLVPADGFYEWQKLDDGPKPAKQPWRIGLKGGAPFAFAGLYETWHPPQGADIPDRVAGPGGAVSPGGVDGDGILSFSIVTTTANAAIAKIHARMPVMLAPEDFAPWLAPDATDEELQGLLRPFPAEAMGFYRVSTRVNAVRNDDEACIAPLAAGTPVPGP